MSRDDQPKWLGYRTLWKTPPAYVVKGEVANPVYQNMVIITVCVCLCMCVCVIILFGQAIAG